MKKNKQIIMRSLILLFLFITILGYSQSTKIYLADYKTYNIIISNLDNQNMADELAGTIQKSFLSEFAWIDYPSGKGYFIMEKNKPVSKIEAVIKNTNNYTFSNTQEIDLSDDLYLEIYTRKGRMEVSALSFQEPKYLMIENENTSALFFHNAKEIWIKNYPEAYNSVYHVKVNNNNKEYIPEHYPKFINTGNPEQDNSVYAKSKQEWLKNYPEEVEQLRKTDMSK